MKRLVREPDLLAKDSANRVIHATHHLPPNERHRNQPHRVERVR